MALTVYPKALRPAMRTVRMAIPAVNNIPILSTVRMGAAGGVLTLEGTDMEVYLRVTTPCGPNDALASTPLNAKALASFLAKAPGEAAIRFEGGNDASVTGRWPGGAVKLPALLDDDYPRPRGMGTDPIRCAITAGALRDMLARVSHAMGTDTSRWYLCGIAFQREDETLVAVAVDGHRIMSASAPLPDGAEAWPMGSSAPIVPRATVAMLGKLLAPLGNLDAVEIGLSADPTGMTFAAGDWHLRTKLIDGTFPDWRRVLGETTGAVLDVVSGAALARLVAVTTSPSSERRADVAIVPADDGTPTLRWTSPEDGECSASIPPDVATWRDDARPEPLRGFQGRYLADLCGAVPDRLAIWMPDGMNKQGDGPAPSRIDYAGGVGTVMPVGL